MIQGYYTAAAGVLMQEKRLNTISQNIINNNTAGYKKDAVVTSTFGEYMMSAFSSYYDLDGDPIGGVAFSQIVDDVYTVYTQGSYNQTDRTVDMSIWGEGFFGIENDGNVYLTRNGQFEVDEEGYLYLPGSGRVVGDDGYIQTGGSEFYVDSYGRVFVDSVYTNTISVLQPEDINALHRVNNSNGLYTGDYMRADNGVYEVKQGILENSNVDIADEMTKLISAQRLFQASSKLVTMYDTLNQKAVNEIARYQ